MTTPTQGEVRAWARAQGMTVNDRGSLPAPMRAAYDAAHRGSPDEADVTAAAPAGVTDLAAGLRDLLDAIDAEVRAVSTLSERIDALVVELNAVRDEQAKRLVALDDLQGAVTDPSLGTFFSRTIKPHKARVPEVIPERLQ